LSLLLAFWRSVFFLVLFFKLVLREFTFGIEINKNNQEVINLLQSIKPNEYQESGKKLGINEEEQKKIDEEYNKSINRQSLTKLFEDLEQTKLNKLFVNEFEKDDDTNFHIEFIHNLSNLRAETYKITTVDKLTTKKIAGKIIPAIATTTSLVSGLVALEFVKVLLNKNKLADYKTYFINLGLPMFTFSEPVEVSVNTLANGKFKFTLWDTFDFKDVELKQIFSHFNENFNINLNMVLYGQKMIYSGFMNPLKAEERMDMKISDILKEINEKYKDYIAELSVVGEINNKDNPDQENEEEIELPICKIYL
jgi:ubiquitin-activating enzyme E1